MFEREPREVLRAAQRAAGLVGLGNYRVDDIIVSPGSMCIRLVDDKRQEVARSSFIEYPCCCAGVIFAHTLVHPSYRGQGIGSRFLQMRLAVARALLYAFATATTTTKNAVENHLLKSAGFSESPPAHNLATGNTVIHWIKVF